MLAIFSKPVLEDLNVKSKKPGDGCSFLFFFRWDFLYLLILCKED